MTILIPVDFSGVSKAAAFYAAKLAIEIQADLILFSVINTLTSGATSINWKKLQDEMIIGAQIDADRLIKEIREEVTGTGELAFHYSVGYPIHDVIESFASENDVDLIVMGTTGATGLKKILFGSNTTAVINRSSTPVLAVPEEAGFKQITKIIYASDMTNPDDEIKILVAYANLFDASIHVLHVIPLHATKEFDSENTLKRLKEVSDYPKITLHILKHDEPGEAIDNFVTVQKADILAMFTHKLDFLEKLSKAGLTRQLAYHSHIPMLLFNKNTLTRKFLKP